MARADTQVKWLQRVFQLSHWDITVEWNAKEDDEGSTSAEAKYQRATIRFNVHEVNTACVAHEFCHVLVSRLADVAERYAKSNEDGKDDGELPSNEAVLYAEEEVCTAMECGLVWMLRRVGLR